MIGIDEAGRGAWAGPLVVAGCYFTENPSFISRLNDSKKLTRKSRAELEPYIKSASLYKVVSVPPFEIDTMGLTECIKQAILKIVRALPADGEILIDGAYNFLKESAFEPRARVEVRADGKYPCVMAASILAKVERDRIMHRYAEQYPQYGFDRHVGYGTLVHRETLRLRGPCNIHRLSYRPVKEAKGRQ